MTKSLGDHKRNVYSQNGEDGVIAEIFRRLSIKTGWFCEFGAWDGRWCSNTYKLLREGWQGVMIEGDRHRYARLAELERRFPDRLHTINAFVARDQADENRLDALLARTPIPRKFELISIDTDRFEYQEWDTLEVYQPMVVVIEIQSSILPGHSVVHSAHGIGSSFSAMLELGRRKNYTPIVHTGNLVGNLFFVCNELVDRLDIPAEQINNPDSLFCTDWVNPTRTQIFLRRLKTVTWQRAAIKIENLLRNRKPP